MRLGELSGELEGIFSELDSAVVRAAGALNGCLSDDDVEAVTLAVEAHGRRVDALRIAMAELVHTSGVYAKDGHATPRCI